MFPDVLSFSVTFLICTESVGRGVVVAYIFGRKFALTTLIDFSYAKMQGCSRLVYYLTIPDRKMSGTKVVVVVVIVASWRRFHDLSGNRPSDSTWPIAWQIVAWWAGMDIKCLCRKNNTSRKGGDCLSTWSPSDVTPVALRFLWTTPAMHQHTYSTLQQSPLYCATQTFSIGGAETAGHENDWPSNEAWKCRT